MKNGVVRLPFNFMARSNYINQINVDVVLSNVTLPLLARPELVCKAPLHPTVTRKVPPEAACWTIA